MIITKLVSLLFSLPFFKSFTFSDDAISSLSSLISLVYQVGDFLNLELMFETIFVVLGLLLLSSIVNTIRGIF